MNFIIYDLALLVIFVLAVAFFLHKNKKNLKKEGLLFLYKADWGIKLINKIGNKYKKTLKALSYASVFLGYILMIAMLWLFYTIVKIYLLRPDVVSQIKVPPIMPLIPYIDKVVPFLPPFYFTYWIIILAVIAITHEFSHGIFAAYNKVGIKKTGFGFFPFFLPVFLAAFVELDEKKMPKKSNFAQRAVLSAGTFANVLTAVFFFIIIAIFFSLAFHPAGVVFNDYSYSIVGLSSISYINGMPVNNLTYDKIAEITNGSSINNISTENGKYIGIKGFVNEKQIALYEDAPAIRNQINGAIIEINNVKVKNVESLSEELAKYSIGDKITIKTKTSNETKTYNIVLEESPYKKGNAWLGIGIVDKKSSGLMNSIVMAISSFRDSNTYYESGIGESGLFIYNLLWWLILISISVALVNMLPMGIFDGGRFFYLTVLAVTGKESWAKNSFKWATYILLLVLLALMVFWGLAFIR